MNTPLGTLKFGLLFFIPVSLLTFYFSAYACNDHYSIIENCLTYQIVLALAAPFILGFVVEKLNAVFAKKVNSDSTKTFTKVANRIFAVPIAIFAFIVTYVYVGFTFYPDTSAFAQIVSLAFSALVAILVFLRLSKV